MRLGQATESIIVAANYKDNEITNKEYQAMRRKRIETQRGLYWFRGIKMNINVIATITKKSVRQLRYSSKMQNMSMQEYVKTLEHTKYKYTSIKCTNIRTSKPIEFRLNNMSITELSIKYNINRGSIYKRYYLGYRTHNQLVLGKDLRINGKRNYEHSTD